MADTQPAPAAQAGQPKRALFDLLPMGSPQHTYLWTEKSGGLFALFLAFFHWVLPLHNILAWQPWAILLVGALFVVVSGWYPNAQTNGVENAVRSEGSIDSKQVNRDFTWSIVPAIPIVISWVLWGVALVLMGWHTQDFSNPNTWWIRDRMLVSPVMFSYDLFALWLIKVDLGNNNMVLSEILQLTGRLLRFERSSSDH